LLAVGPIRTAAGDEEIGGFGFVDTGVERPELFAGFGFEGDDAVEGGGEVHDAVGDQGGGLEGGAHDVVFAVGNFAGFEFPGEGEFGDVCAGDLFEFGVLLAAGVAAPVVPLLGLYHGEGGEEEERAHRIGISLLSRCFGRWVDLNSRRYRRRGSGRFRRGWRSSRFFYPVTNFPICRTARASPGGSWRPRIVRANRSRSIGGGK
jgi:hypothetical protein